MRVLVDFRNETIAVADVDEERSDRGFEIVVRARHKLGQLLITDALVEGVRATVIIDTGAQTSMGNLALRERIRARRGHDVETTDVHGVRMIGHVSKPRAQHKGGLEMSAISIANTTTPT